MLLCLNTNLAKIQQLARVLKRPLHCLIQCKRRANTLFLEGYYERLVIFHFLCRDCRYWAAHQNTSFHCPSPTLSDHLMLRCNSCAVPLAIFHHPFYISCHVVPCSLKSWHEKLETDCTLCRGGWPVSSQVGGDVCFASCLLQAACRSNIGA